MNLPKTTPHWPTPILIILAELSALAATLYLFLVPAFNKYQGIIFPDSKPPGLETGWHHFGFWPPIPNTPPDKFVLYLMIAPPVIAALGIFSLGIKQTTVKVSVLWASVLIIGITMVPRIADFGFLFVPAAAFLFSTSIIETRRAIVNRLRRA